MKIIKKISALHEEILKLKRQRKTIGFVPTMGFFHEGHVSLMKKSKKENKITVVSIFVNSKQFGPNEDLAKYPRDLKRDETFAKTAKVDILFLPSADEMYPPDYLTHVTVDKISDILCGHFRPGHFRGVATVVLKLLNIVSPDVMYLGQKDAQQTIVLKQMIKDLNLPVKVKIMPTIREKEGLAMSSRNSYLAPEQHKKASILYKALTDAKTAIEKGERSPEAIIAAIQKNISVNAPMRMEYIQILNAETLTPLRTLHGKILIVLAGWLDKTRLIDNIIVEVK